MKLIDSNWYYPTRRNRFVITWLAWSIGFGVFRHHKDGLTVSACLGPFIWIWSRGKGN